MRSDSASLSTDSACGKPTDPRISSYRFDRELTVELERFKFQMSYSGVGEAMAGKEDEAGNALALSMQPDALRLKPQPA